MTVKSIDEVLTSSNNVVNYISANSKTPTKVNVAGVNVTRAAFNRMMTAAFIEIYNKTMQNIRTDSVKAPGKPTGNLASGNIQLNELLDIAKRVYAFIDSNKQMPNYISTSLGNMSPYNFMDIFSRILNFYKDKGVLPNYAYTNSVANIATSTTSAEVPSSLQPYLKATTNCQVDNTLIRGHAAGLDGSAEAVFNNTLMILDYENYYNTRRGAVKTLQQKQGNCCDHGHLNVALLRSKGIPARYGHGLVKFSKVTCGHIWAEAYVNGAWYKLDTTNNDNKFNAIGGKLNKLYGYYRDLTF